MITNILPAVISGIARGELKAGREVITPSGPHSDDAGIGEAYWAIFWPRCGGNGNLIATWESASRMAEGPHNIKKYSINQKVRFLLRGEGNPLEAKELGDIGFLYVE